MLHGIQSDWYDGYLPKGSSMKAEDRLTKIRSIIRETEDALDRIDCDQLPLLRQAFLDIIIAAGPQHSGRKKIDNDQANRQKRANQKLCRGNSNPSGDSSSNRQLGYKHNDDSSRRTLCRKDLVNTSKTGGRANSRDKYDQYKDSETGVSPGRHSIGETSRGVRDSSEVVHSREEIPKDLGKEMSDGLFLDQRSVSEDPSSFQSTSKGRRTEEIGRYTEVDQRLHEAAKVHVQESSSEVAAASRQPLRNNMLLDECPLCKRIKEDKYEKVGSSCAAMEIDGVKVVALLRHDTATTVDEVSEACGSVSRSGGIVGGLDVPGHWAIAVKSGEWTAGKSTGHSDDPKS